MPDRVLIGLACAAVLAVYGWLAKNAEWPEGISFRPDNYYMLLVDGFKAGRLDVAKPVPAGLVALADPYDPVANADFRGFRGLHDMSYYKGKLYLYFGAAPAMMLFLPYSVLTGQPLPQEWAVAVFCAGGFAAGAGLLCLLRRKYFPEVGGAVTAAGVLAIGLGAGAPILLMRPDVYEVAISCSVAMVMVSLAAVGAALTGSSRRLRWLGVASFTYGLAVAARPSVLFGAVILLVPVFLEWREQSGPASWRWALKWLATAAGPIAAVGICLLAYNYARFDNPLQFGQRYQLAGLNVYTARRIFSPEFFGFNFRIYFLEPMRWGIRFPFVQGIRLPPLPEHHFGAENPFGIIPNVPLIWLLVALPLSWRGRAAAESRALRTMIVAALILFVTSATVLCLFLGASSRYESEFLPPLILLAATGVLAVERTLASRPLLRGLARGLWGTCLAFSIGFNLLVGLGPVGSYPSVQNNIGYALLDIHRVPQAVQRFRMAIRFNPNFAEAHCNLGTALFEAGDMEQAIASFTNAIRLLPGFVEARNNLGLALQRTGRLAEAKKQFEIAVQLRPGFSDARFNLARVDEMLRTSIPQTEPAR